MKHLSQYNFNNIFPDEESPKLGGGPDHGGDGGQNKIRMQGFLSMAFGFATGFTFVAMWALLKFRIFGEHGYKIIEGISGDLNFFAIFFIGFISGTFLSIVYNLLVVQKLNLFGFDRYFD